MSVEFKKKNNITFSRRGSCGPDQLLLYILITNEGAAAEEEKKKNDGDHQVCCARWPRFPITRGTTDPKPALRIINKSDRFSLASIWRNSRQNNSISIRKSETSLLEGCELDSSTRNHFMCYTVAFFSNNNAKNKNSLNDSHFFFSPVKTVGPFRHGKRYSRFVPEKARDHPCQCDWYQQQRYVAAKRREEPNMGR